MGVMIDGQYFEEDPAPDSETSGEFKRKASSIRNWIGQSGFAAEAGRYHLFVAWNCPWAHRALLTRALLGLEDAISVSYAKPRRTAQGWVFDADGAFDDPLLGVMAVHEVYGRHRPAYTGRITVPVLWDKQTGVIVNNESADIVRMLNAAFGGDLYPDDLAPQIDEWNELIYSTFNNGVYRAGFARTQEAYDKGVADVFATMKKVEAHLAGSRYLCGDRFSEADLRMFPTLARFDVAYHYAFKCNLHRLMDYPNLWGYAREIYQMRGVAQTVNFDIYKQGYFSPSELRNPLGIVPAGPVIDWDAPHGRG
ncbi:MAG: glutathione S-transferase C-terminal domain-containing protein [Amylibacter sp.]|nr:glutathione S-transferase C-terminal domain-containing protein [Amylibacter sp.]